MEVPILAYEDMVNDICISGEKRNLTNGLTNGIDLPTGLL